MAVFEWILQQHPTTACERQSGQQYEPDQKAADLPSDIKMVFLNTGLI
ncbi:hypothetical protein [Sphingobacterium sp.]